MFLMLQLNSSSQNECLKKNIATNLMGLVTIEIVFSGYHSCTFDKSKFPHMCGESEKKNGQTNVWHVVN